MKSFKFTRCISLFILFQFVNTILFAQIQSESEAIKEWNNSAKAKSYGTVNDIDSLKSKLKSYYNDEINKMEEPDSCFIPFTVSGFSLKEFHNELSRQLKIYSNNASYYSKEIDRLREKYGNTFCQVIEGTRQYVEVKVLWEVVGQNCGRICRKLDSLSMASYQSAAPILSVIYATISNMAASSNFPEIDEYYPDYKARYWLCKVFYELNKQNNSLSAVEKELVDEIKKFWYEYMEIYDNEINNDNPIIKEKNILSKMMYETGMSIIINNDKQENAFELFKYGTELKNNKCEMMMAYCLMIGCGCKQDKERALKIVETAAKNNSNSDAVNIMKMSSNN